MKIAYDGTQPFQLAAVDAVVNLFEGQPFAQTAFESSYIEEGILYENGCVGNSLILADEQLLENLQAVQKDEMNCVPASEHAEALASKNFSVEMETGTGKTYVYLRTIHRLHQRYGWRKFIIVVPTVAIREGVKQSLDAMKGHFELEFDRQTIDSWVYDSKDINKVRSFGRDNDLKVMVMTLASFNKRGNVLYQEREGLGQGIDMIAATRPIVILDEPQKMESATSVEAIANLKPLFTLRYSATHAKRYHQVYNLDPVRAYDLGLVKQIKVRSVVQDLNVNATTITVKKVTGMTGGPVADLQMLELKSNGKIASVIKKVRKVGTSLYELSGGLSQYGSWTVEEIRSDTKEVIFANDVIMREGEQRGIDREALMRTQIFETVQKHLDHENYLRRRITSVDERMKVLSVIFIDKVANYVPMAGSEPKIRAWFEEAYAELSGQERYAKLELPPLDKVHDGYFSVDKKGTAKDSSGDTSDDYSAYEKIMQNKTLLLDLNEPLRFIFSHSALREGWDNPNVFQICTLNESVSADRKRQEIGRGLRLPVMANGQRCFDPAVNTLTVIANEHYEDFAAALQTEIEEETGVKFGKKRIANDRDQIAITLTVDHRDSDLHKLLRAIAPRTRYEVSLDSDKLRDAVVCKLQHEPSIEAPKIKVSDGGISIVRGSEEETGGVRARQLNSLREAATVSARPRIPDVLGYLQNETGLTRGSLAKIVKASGRIPEINVNPMAVLGLLARVINEAKAELMVEGISYHRLPNDGSFEWALDLVLDQDGQLVDSKSLVEVQGSAFSHIRFDSEVEKAFADSLSERSGLEDTDGDIRLFLKLPSKFKVPTPLGNYNPDWAILKIDRIEGREQGMSLVVETKSTHELAKLRDSERRKIACGREHFKAIDVQYRAPVVTADEI